MKIKVAIAEDNSHLAKSIIEKLSFFEDHIQFKFRAVNGKKMLEKLEDDHNIDVILMDIEMPELNGILTTSQVLAKHPQIKVLILTVFDDEEKIFQAIQAGAMGYLLKDETPEKIFDAINLIVEGGAPMSPSIAVKALNILRNPMIRENESINEDYNLSKREIEVLEQLSHGLDYKEIASNLFISASTVRKHIENIYKKLQVHNKVEAVNKALKNNLI